MVQQGYDVVVIGGGMGGMCAGALAVKEGYKTLVAEKRDIVGGRFSSKVMDGFKMETGAP
ncbi:NAD(P)-binding protein, partial [Chloroflexota bacterium]